MSGSQRPLPGPVPFDPSAGLFQAQASRPPHLEPVDLGGLTPFQRALLVIDGTVTTFLEAWALEPIEVRRLWQHGSRLAAAETWLDASPGTPVLDRAVMLVGRRSGSFFAFAESRILPGRLPEAMQRSLEAGTGGLGQILLASGSDTRREGLWFGREHRADLPGAVRAVSDGDFLTRTYRVLSGGEPWMLITERFPWRPVALPPGGVS